MYLAIAFLLNLTAPKEYLGVETTRTQKQTSRSFWKIFR